jgi:membrane-bound lytic murein transglycosylase F
LSGAGILTESRGNRRIVHRFAVPAAACLLASLSACDQFSPDAPAPIRKRGELRVVTLNMPTCYYLGAQNTEGLEFELASAFAKRLRVKLVMYPVADERAMQTELAAGRADIAACSLTSTPEWSGSGMATLPYARIPQLVVYQRGSTRPHDLRQIGNANLEVHAGSAQETMLRRLKMTVEPALKWTATAADAADPVENVDSGDAQYALIDAREFSFARHLYPNVLVAFALPEQRSVQWMVARGQNQLMSRVNSFFRGLTASGQLADLMEETSGDTRAFAYEESREFQEHFSERLPHYRDWFEKAATQTGSDWRLLAAVGYQESKWDPHAESGNGALGVMMLTTDTAQAMGIHDRGDPEQSIFAGARYLAEVREKIPERIAEPDRTWLTLAAYNVGYGHLEDARVIAQSLGKDPDSWTEVRKQLPKLAEERYYESAKHGYARGWEPVQFVDRVQRYLTLLEWQPGQAAGNADQITVQAAPTPARPPAIAAPPPPPAAPPSAIAAPPTAVVAAPSPARQAAHPAAATAVQAPPAPAPETKPGA